MKDPEELLANLDIDELLGYYDEAAHQLLEVARSDGHFAGWDETELSWPTKDGLDAAGLAQRARLIGHIHDGIPPRRQRRLQEAHARYSQSLPAYHRANRIYMQVRRQFVERGAGSERDFLQLYQNFYLRALGREDPFPMNEGEAALIQWGVARTPRSHAQSVAEKLQDDDGEDPRCNENYTYVIDGESSSASLGGILSRNVEYVVDHLAAGEHLAIRYNTFSNFIWFGISVLKAVTDLELLLDHLHGRVRQAWHDKLLRYVRLDQAMLLKFLQAHQEDPAQIRPKDYWYGQEYSYLTRDMIDLTRVLIERGNALRRRARGADPAPEVEVPPLLCGAAAGLFDEYPHVGRSRSLSSWQRRTRLLRWARLFRRIGRQKIALEKAGLDEQERLQQSWHQDIEWGTKSLEIFGVEVKVLIDPLFAEVAADLDLRSGNHKILFYPTHQSVLDHPVMNYVLQAPELLQAMGWEKSVPGAILARAGLTAPAMVGLGPLQFSLIGFAPEEVDRILETICGHIILHHSKDTGNPARRFAQLLEKRPGVIYGAGTTSAFALQCLPMQHALFAQLPPDVVIVPMAFRGIHSLWPKCPKGNLDISPGLVEVVVSPPMLGETTLLPRKRALRTQLEPATLFQAVHIATLLNPELPT